MQLLRVKDWNSRLYAEALAILREAIAPEAQLPEQRFSDLLGGGSYRLYAYAKADDVRGVALVYFSDDLRFAWLDYFAIRFDLRGLGLGSDLFREIVRVASKQSPQRLGARVLENVRYKFPSAFAEPIRMRLMAYQLLPDASLSPHDLSQVVKQVFLNIHGRGNDDDLLRWFQQNLPDSIEMK
jgi:GNAT superfamily N-acetyltransferase